MDNKITIVTTHMILDSDTLDMSMKCIDKIRENTYNKYRLVSIDNASNPSAISYLTANSDIYIRNSTNRGNALMWDQGMSLPENNIVILMDNDVFVEKDWDKEMVDKLSKLAIGVTFPYSILGTNDYRATEYKSRRDGFCFALRKNTYDNAGPFLQDQPFHSYFEDDNFFMNVMQIGLKLVSCSTSKVFHKGQGTTKRILNKEIKDGIEANEKWYNNKWNGEYPQLTQ